MRHIFLFICCLLCDEILGAGLVKQGKIVGGYSAEENQFPYQASLRTSLLNTHFCGGFILTERWLASAGHCTEKRKAANIVVVVGAASRSKEEGIKHNVFHIAIHPEFNSKTLQNDISMIKTETFIEFTTSVKPIRMQARIAPADSDAIVSGWGYTTSGGTNPEKLQYIKVLTIPLEDCRDKMSQQNKERIFDTNICAMPTDSSGGACMGDSGGPLVSDGALIGIVSWGVPCGKGLPDVYTRVSPYHNWIDETIDFPIISKEDNDDDDDDYDYYLNNDDEDDNENDFRKRKMQLKN